MIWPSAIAWPFGFERARKEIGCVGLAENDGPSQIEKGQKITKAVYAILCVHCLGFIMNQ
ncbi:MAG: hypothetical protein LBT59_26590 [Clostridiales bacterium]|nr:hypothetical protein [Clostridiales bacterium]